MIIGHAGVFAVESGITEAYARLSLKALGFFVIHIGGSRYGVYESDATALANSLDEVRRRIAQRGLHTAPFAAEPDAGKIADAFRNAMYADEPSGEFFGIRRDSFSNLVHSNHIVWAPDGDEAFDDGSYILQFDVQDWVRLIAFKCVEDWRHDPLTLRDVWIGAEDFYPILHRWQEGFETEWETLRKKEIEDFPF